MHAYHYGNLRKNISYCHTYFFGLGDARKTIRLLLQKAPPAKHGHAFEHEFGFY